MSARRRHHLATFLHQLTLLALGAAFSQDSMVSWLIWLALQAAGVVQGMWVQFVLVAHGSCDHVLGMGAA